MTPAEPRRDERGDGWGDEPAREGQRGRRERERGRSRRGAADDDPGALAARHIRGGWWLLLVFLSLGVVLETLLAWRSQTYLGVGNETRRLLWRLAHAHGTLLSLVNIAFGVTIAALKLDQPRLKQVASPCLLLAALLIPAGFFLGGAFVYGSDPGLGAVLVPIGALLLFIAVLLTALSASKK